MAVLFNYEYDIEAVYALLTDPDFLVERALALGDLEATANATATDQGMDLSMSRSMVNDLPNFTKRVLGDSQEIKLEESWQNSGDIKTAVYSNQVVGKPISMAAKIELKTTEAGCSYSFDSTAKIKIPIIGGKLGGLIASKSDRQITEECQYVSDYLDANS